MRFQTTALIGSLCVLGYAGHANAGLTAHYTLDSIDSGTTAPDSTGNADGTLNGTGISVVAGAIGNAYDFTGATSQFVEIADPAFGKTAFTSSFWFNPDSLGGQGTVSNWTNVGPAPRTFLIRTSGSGELQTFARNGGTQIGGTTTFTTEALTASGFNHVVYSYDGRFVRTYLNGELSGDVHDFGSTGITLGEGSLGTVSIGGRGSSENSTNGLIDDVAFWDETLTNDEVIGLSQVAGINYNASQFQQLKAVHDAGTGNVTIDGKVWSYRSGLSGSAGLNGGQDTLVLDATANTGLVDYILRVDFNSDSNGSLSDTQPGWLGTDASGNGTDGTYTVTTTAVGGGTIDDRDRGTGNGGGDEADMWNDFLFSNDGSTGTTKGLEVTVDGLDANADYTVTIWAFDASSTGPVRSADWSVESGDSATLAFDANGTGPGLPTDLTSNYTITLNATSNASGEIVLTGLPSAAGSSNNHDVFINGLEIALVPEPSSLALLGLGGLALLRRRR
ncbi:MAG: LamG domain-containing protein [Planctomycetota bacterium]